MEDPTTVKNNNDFSQDVIRKTIHRELRGHVSKKI